MGTLTIAIRVCKPGRRPRWAAFDKVMVDPGSEATWLPEADLRSVGVGAFKKAQRFVMASGQQVIRDVGIAAIQAGEFKTVDEVVFATPGELLLLGARTIEGFNAVVDARKRKLLPAGPIPAARAGGADEMGDVAAFVALRGDGVGDVAAFVALRGCSTVGRGRSGWRDEAQLARRGEE